MINKPDERTGNHPEVCFAPSRTNQSSSVVKIPSQEIFLAQSVRWNLVMNLGSRHIENRYARIHEPKAKLRVFSSDFTAYAGTKVRAEYPEFRECFASECHIGAVRRIL